MHPPPFVDADRDSWHDFMMPDDDMWGNPMEEPPHGWERIDDDPFMDMMDEIGPGPGGPASKHPPPPPSNDRHPPEPPSDGQLEAAKHDKHHHHHHTTTTTDTHHHHHETTTSEHKESTSSTHHTTTTTTSSTTSSSVATTQTPANNAPPPPPPPPTAQQHNAAAPSDPAMTPSSLSESPVLVSSSPSPPSSPMPAAPLDNEQIQDIGKNNQAQQQQQPETSYVVSTVYAVHTMMPGSYPRIDYNEIDYGQLGQIGVFTDGAASSHELHVTSFWMSFAVTLTLLFMLRNI